MPNRLMRLLRDNAQARARAPFKAEATGDEVTLYVYDIIVDDDYYGGLSAMDFVKQLAAITAPVVHIRINSPGGDVLAARAMEQAIREHPSKCIAHVDGYAASAASFVALACDEVVMGMGAFFMIHRAWTIEAGNCEDFAKTAAWLDKFDGTIAATYVQETGQDLDAIIAMMSDETWLTAQESVDLGFADRIEEGANKVQNQTGVGWNLSAYAKAPSAVDDGTCSTCGKKTAMCQCGSRGSEATAAENTATEQNTAETEKNSQEVSNRERYERVANLHDISRPDSRVA